MALLPNPMHTTDFGTRRDRGHLPKGLQDPGYVVRCMILDVCKMHIKQFGSEPTHVSLTAEMEDLLRDHYILNYPGQPIGSMGNACQPQRPLQILGLVAEWGAADFDVW